MTTRIASPRTPSSAGMYERSAVVECVAGAESLSAGIIPSVGMPGACEAMGATSIQPSDDHERGRGPDAVGGASVYRVAFIQIGLRSTPTVSSGNPLASPNVKPVHPCLGIMPRVDRDAHSEAQF